MVYHVRRGGPQPILPGGTLYGCPVPTMRERGWDMQGSGALYAFFCAFFPWLPTANGDSGDRVTPVICFGG